ncbi:MAG: NAD(P)-binding domain-containing protein [Geminicoccaceae bacterium]
MRSATAIIVGAGHAGLAMSRRLTERAIDHVVLERGEIAHSWRTERWASLRLLTPNWQSRLPGRAHDGADPDGFRTMPEVIRLLEGYARTIAAPVHVGTRVTSVVQVDGGYRLETSRGPWSARAVVLASGACNTPRVPALAAAIPPTIHTLTPHGYRTAEALPDGGVLVVGASASGVQIAEEILCSGRRVILAVGDHVRAPRAYRGRDIQWWLDRTGVLDQRHNEVEDLARARRLPSFQLVGSADRRTLDLNRLSGMGVELVGRLVGCHDGCLQFSGSLHNRCALADLKLQRLLDLIDDHAARMGESRLPPDRPRPTVVPPSPRLALDMARGEIRTILWATGYRQDLSWLRLPLLDRRGQLVHDGGRTEAIGLYAMGLPFMRRRKSTLIDGAGGDALELAGHLEQCLAGPALRQPRAGWRPAA